MIYNYKVKQNKSYFNNKTNQAISNGRYAVISIDLDTNLDFYLFYLPITCLSWRLINFEPLILAVISETTFSNNLVLKTMEYLNNFQFKVIYLKSEPNYSKMTGMLARLFIGVVDEMLSDNDFIFQTDADLLPINKTYYNNFDNTDSIKLFDVSSFQSPIGKFNYKGIDYQMFFMGHIGMTKKQWREVMQFDQTNKLTGNEILNLVRQFYGDSRIKTNEKIKRGDKVWFLDQYIVSINIHEYLKRTNSKMYKNLSPGIKLDRIWSDKKWIDTFKNKYDSINDVHLFHENYIEKIHFLNLLIKKLFNKSQQIVLNNYINEFMALKKKV